MKSNAIASIAEISKFDEIIDVRTPAEFELDHIPGAKNFPVLSNEERVIVGTAYAKESPFAAKIIGASLIAKAISKHIDTEFFNRPKNWKPLVYCWRGGKRSNSMGHIFRQIGWNACTLDGGYKSYRSWVVEQIKSLPLTFQYCVITGQTGSAKSRILEQLKGLGAQVLDLELLANHKGSVLGGNIHLEQPSQKMFDTQLTQQLSQFDPNRIVYIEAESRKIGNIQVPDALLLKIRESACIRIQASIEARVEFLLRDYDYMIAHPEVLLEKLSHLRALVGSDQFGQWGEQIQGCAWPELVQSLLEEHYDKLYLRSQLRNFTNYQHAPIVETSDLSDQAILRIAEQILDTQSSSTTLLQI